MSGTLNRKVAKRTYPWSPSPPQDEVIPAAKKRRRIVPFPATAEEAVTTMTASADAEEAITPAHNDPMTAMQSSTRASRAPPSASTLESDTDMTGRAENQIIQMKHNSYNEYMKEWSSVAAMAPVSLPTNMQLNGLSGWYPSIYQTTGFTDMWTPDQASLLRILNGMNGYASTAARVPGQMTVPRWNGWSPRGGVSHPTIAQTTGWLIADQGNILETQHNVNNGLVLDPSQTTTSSCRNRLDEAVDTPVDRTTGRMGRLRSKEVDIDQTTKHSGKWAEKEDGKLLRAAEKFAVTRWEAIAALIPGRTKKQCWNRWQYALDPSIVRMTERKGRWLPEEDDRLVGAVEKHNGKNWDAIAALVPSRTKRQCMDRWHKVLDTSVC